jgi:hypothetical protein
MNHQLHCSPSGMLAILLPAVFLLASCGGNEGTKPPPPTCQISPDTLLFGTVLLGETGDQIFTITNSGGGTLAGSITLSCPAFRLVGGPHDNYTYSLGAGQSATVTVRFAPALPGPDTCSIGTGTGCGIVSASGTGDLPPSCQVTPAALEFGAVMIGQNVDRSFRIKNIGGGIMSGSVTASCTAYSIQSGAGAWFLAANEERTVTVRFTPLTTGLQSCTVSLESMTCGTVACMGLGTGLPPTPER